MTEFDDTQPRGDLADQATDAIFAAEEEAIQAALRRKEPSSDAADDASPRFPDEPELDLGDGDDSDDAVHAGGDPVGLTRGGGPIAPDDLAQLVEHMDVVDLTHATEGVAGDEPDE